MTILYISPETVMLTNNYQVKLQATSKKVLIQGPSWPRILGRSDPAGKLGRSDSQIGRSYSAKLWHFCQFRSNLAITHTITI